MSRAIFISLVLLLTRPAWAEPVVLEIPAGGETFRIQTYNFPAERLARLKKFLDRVGALEWSKSTPMHEDVFGGKAGGATYLRYIQTNSAGLAYDELVKNMSAMRPPANVLFYTFKKKLARFFTHHARTVSIGRGAFDKDGEMKEVDFFQTLQLLLVETRSVGRHRFQPCSTEDPKGADVLSREGFGLDECDADPRGVYATAALFVMNLQLNRPDLGVDVGTLPVGSALTGEARRRVLLDIRSTSLLQQIGALVMISNEGNGKVELRSCPVPPPDVDQIAIDREACESLTDGKGIDLRLTPRLDFAAGPWVNPVQMRAILNDVQAVVNRPPGSMRARVVQKPILEVLRNRSTEL